jgi:hypothetical protein
MSQNPSSPPPPPLRQVMVDDNMKATREQAASAATTCCVRWMTAVTFFYFLPCTILGGFLSGFCSCCCKCEYDEDSGCEAHGDDPHCCNIHWLFRGNCIFAEGVGAFYNRYCWASSNGETDNRLLIEECAGSMICTCPWVYVLACVPASLFAIVYGIVWCCRKTFESCLACKWTEHAKHVEKACVDNCTQCTLCLCPCCFQALLPPRCNLSYYNQTFDIFF